MYVVQNLTGRKIMFQGMTILPYGNLMVSSVTDSTNLSKLINAGKISCTLMKKEVEKKPTTFAETKKQEKVETKVEVPVAKEKTFAEKKAEKKPVVEEEVKQEPEKVDEPVVEEKKEEVDTKKKPTKKYGKKWDN